MILPKQLQRPEFRFILLANRSKKAIEKGWNKDKNYCFDDPNVKNHNGNLGIVCGIGNLAVIDCDTPKLKWLARSNFPETFEVTTGRGLHLYYFIPELRKKIVLNSPKEHLGEIQSVGTYIVAPNSIHPTGVVYTGNKKKIATLSLNRIKEVLGEFIGDQPTEPKKKYVSNGNSLRDKISEKISIFDLVRRYGFELKGNKAICKFHGEKEPSLVIYPETNSWYCFGCNRGGGVIEFVAECKINKITKKQ